MSASRPRTGAAREQRSAGNPAPRSRLLVGLPHRPNTAASVKGNEILRLPNEWALDDCKGLDEKPFLLDMVKQNGDFLQYASVRMRRDPDIVMAAVKNKGYAMKYAGAELVEDPGFMMKIVTECSRLYKYAGVKAYEFSPLEYAQTNVRKNRAIVLEAVTRQAFSLCFADAELRDDAEFVQDCVTRNGLALEYISKRLKMNMMIVETAIKQNPNALVYAAPDVRHDPGILKMVAEMQAAKSGYMSRTASSNKGQR